MARAAVLATLVLAASGVLVLGAQNVSVLHIKVTLLDAERKGAPVPNHALLISDNPPTATPRRVLTGPDGTADVRLRPGSYTVESDRPMTFLGRSYQWTQMVRIVAGRDAVLELTSANAEVGAAPAAADSAAPALEADLSSLLIQWQDSVVTLWTPTTHASGFVIGSNGLIATNQRLLGNTMSVEVQLTPTVKAAGVILESDAARDVAVLSIGPRLAGAVHPIPLGCGALKPPVNGQEIFTIGAPLRQQKGPSFGNVTGVEAHGIVSDLILPSGSAGGPVFTAGGNVVGLTSTADEKDEQKRGTSRIVRVDDVCEVVAAVQKKIGNGPTPGGAPLPVEPEQTLPVDALKEIVKGRAGSLNPYQITSTDFDIAFVTPVHLYGVQYQAEQMNARNRGNTRTPYSGQIMVNPLLQFGNWEEYVVDIPSVLLVRVTPRLVEGFWTKVARGAAVTQGMVLPAFKRFKSGFLRMRAFCGDTEVTPIHPFRIEQHISETESIYEGLYVFDPGALTPSCGIVKLVLYSEKEPEKADTKIIDAKVVQEVWQDFAPYRDTK